MADPFADRFDAGLRLAGALQNYAGTDAVVVGLARGGVEVGAAVATALGLSLRVLVVRKVGAPNNPELAVGAVSETGLHWIDQSLKKATGASKRYLEATVASQATQAKQQQLAYGENDLHEALRGRVAILVDDGIATGATALVAIRSVRAFGASRVVLATPVASAQATSALRRYADDVIVLVTPEPFRAVGLHYDRFDQLDDETVLRRLGEARARTSVGGTARQRIDEVSVEVSTESGILPAILSVPVQAIGLVVFAHGSGSGRLSPRNGAVARILSNAGIATLLADLLTEEEAADRRKVFDIELLAGRLLACIEYARHNTWTSQLPVGLFGASTGAAVALVAATEPSAGIRAVVSRGGRTDLAAGALEEVRCPTLLLVGGADKAVIALNRHAFDRLLGETSLVVIPDASHLFEEAGTLEEVARISTDWFVKYLPV